MKSAAERWEAHLEKHEAGEPDIPIEDYAMLPFSEDLVIFDEEGYFFIRTDTTGWIWAQNPGPNQPLERIFVQPIELCGWTDAYVMKDVGYDPRPFRVSPPEGDE